MEPNIPKTLDLTRLPPQAAKAVYSHYESLLQQSARLQMSREEWLKEFDEWVMSHHDVKGVADDSRDSIYD